MAWTNGFFRRNAQSTAPQKTDMKMQMEITSKTPTPPMARKTF